MPYNNAAIPPSTEPTGATQLPLSRIKRIVMVDNDIAVLSTPAAFAITVATEIFIQYLATEAHNVVKLERKPRRNIQYRDISSATSRLDNLEFLQDIVPKTVAFKTVKGPKAPKASATNGASTRPTEVQSTLTMNGASASSGSNGVGVAGPSATNGTVDEDDDGGNPDEQLQRESSARQARGRVSDGSTIEEARDVEME